MSTRTPDMITKAVSPVSGIIAPPWLARTVLCMLSKGLNLPGVAQQAFLITCTGRVLELAVFPYVPRFLRSPRYKKIVLNGAESCDFVPKSIFICRSRLLADDPAI